LIHFPVWQQVASQKYKIRFLLFNSFQESLVQGFPAMEITYEKAGVHCAEGQVLSG
jgi:hypothetical protein